MDSAAVKVSVQEDRDDKATSQKRIAVLSGLQAEYEHRNGSTKPATVSTSALALHLDCSRTYIGKLEAEGVIQQQGDGFPLDQSHVAYLRYLRRERRQSARRPTLDLWPAAADLVVHRL